MGTIKFSFSGEMVVVMGGSRGLGLEIVQAFGVAGVTVMITARRKQWLDLAGSMHACRALAILDN